MHGGEGHVPLLPGQQPAAPEPKSVIREENGWKYELRVYQQPRRARMCGFGDKDRRPITPPPCVRLIITDIATGKEVDVNDIEHAMFVLNVDLWNEAGCDEVNLVHHSATSPSISATVPVSYEQAQYINVTAGNPNSGFKAEDPRLPGQNAAYNPYPGPPQVMSYTGHPPQSYGGQQPYSQHPGYAPNGAPYPPQNGYGQPPPPPPPQAPYYTTGPGIHQLGAVANGGYPGAPPQDYPPRQFPQEQTMHRMPNNNATPGGMFTRNLIGSLAASAFRLTDPDDRIGIWFVLQDLSVRTEGHFRLRFSFVNVGIPPGAPGSSAVPQQVPNAPPNTHMVSLTQVNTTKAPVLAQVFSDVFTVYSAKRFPGVVESTPLSKCFATQGIKIPIRKDGPGKGDKDRDDED